MTLKFAAIDIGSNAVRLLFCNVFEGKNGPVFKKASLIRVPIRLGEDAFINGHISKEKADRLVKTMQAFKILMDVHQVVGYRACATSAMREASNNTAIIMRLYKEAGIHVNIVDGQTEAAIIYSNQIAEMVDPTKNYLYIDVGGGSTELTLFSNNKIIASHSFNIGTVRILHNQVNKKDWSSLKEWIENNITHYKNITAIGSGGNINKLNKLVKKKDHKPLEIEKLKEITEYVENFSYEERIEVLGLNPDRADVIVPAGRIFLTIMRAADIKQILVPEIGLSDGLVHQMYEEYLNKKQLQRS